MNARTQPFRPVPFKIARSAGTNAIKTFNPPIAKNTPITPPSMDSKMLSASNWRINRHGPAPRAVRTAISLSRAALRTRSKFTIFAQAISRTSPTAPNKTSKVPRKLVAEGS